MRILSLAAAAALLSAPTAALDPACLALAGSNTGARAAAASLRKPVGLAAPVTCGTSDPRGVDSCFLLCGVCSTPVLAMELDADTYASMCAGQTVPSNASLVANVASQAFMNASALQGIYWLDDPGDLEENATAAVAHLLQYMPRRDLLWLFTEPLSFMDFLTDHVRHALLTRQWSYPLGVTWDLFLDYVLPIYVLDEKRDVSWRPRARLAQLLQPMVAAAPNLTAAMHIISDAIPALQTLGVLGFLNGSTGAQQLAPGAPITWKSSVSPAFLSVQQVAQHAGSCTGTGVVMVTAARAVGIPTRLAGCSETVVRGDDHHWAEFYDPTAAGPFGDNWHTKEGTSAGNTGGPWDSPSGPMLGCLQGVVPGSSIDTLWAVQYSSQTFLPTLWSMDAYSSAWAFIGGQQRCGAYCTAWGCGTNNTQHWNQTQCGPTSA